VCENVYKFALPQSLAPILLSALLGIEIVSSELNSSCKDHTCEVQDQSKQKCSPLYDGIWQFETCLTIMINNELSVKNNNTYLVDN